MVADTDLVKLLLSKGADVNCRTKDGQTPLLLAVTNTNRGMILQLVAAGANPDASDNTGVSPWSEARNRGLSDIEAILKPKASTAPALPQPLYRNEVDAYEALFEDSRRTYEAVR